MVYHFDSHWNMFASGGLLMYLNGTHGAAITKKVATFSLHEISFIQFTDVSSIQFGCHSIECTASMPRKCKINN